MRHCVTPSGVRRSIVGTDKIRGKEQTRLNVRYVYIKSGFFLADQSCPILWCSFGNVPEYLRPCVQTGTFFMQLKGCLLNGKWQHVVSSILIRPDLTRRIIELIIQSNTQHTILKIAMWLVDSHEYQESKKESDVAWALRCAVILCYFNNRVMLRKLSFHWVRSKNTNINTIGTPFGWNIGKHTTNNRTKHRP